MALRFGTYQVYASVGKLLVPPTGMAVAEYCFAALYHDRDLRLASVDIYKNYLAYGGP